MSRSNLKEAKTEVLRGKIEIIKTAYPELFKAANTLATALNTATAIISQDGTPYDFQGKTTAIAPFNRFSFKYEPYETMEQSSMKRKWKLHIGFTKKNEELNSDNNLVLLYMGNRDSETPQPQPADMLFLNFLSAKTRVIFDLKNHKIGFANDSNKTSYNIEDYPTVFDQIANHDGLLSDFNENSLIKIYGIEVDQERNIVAFRCQGGLFGETEQTITLPLKMEVKPGEIFKSQLIDIFDEQPPSKSIPEKKPIRMEVKPAENFKSQSIGDLNQPPVHSKVILREKSVPVVVDGKNLEIIIKGNSVIIAIGELKFTLRELTYLYYKFILGLDSGKLFKIIKVTNADSKPIEISLIERNSALISQGDNLKNELIDYSKFYIDCSSSILILLDKATQLGILNEDFIKKLGEVLARI